LDRSTSPDDREWELRAGREKRARVRSARKRLRVQYVAWTREGSIWRDTRMYVDSFKTEKGARNFCVRIAECESRYHLGYACRIEVTSVLELTDEEFTRQREADTHEVFRQLWANRRAKELRNTMAVVRREKRQERS
jgi:hypothetical protein